MKAKKRSVGGASVGVDLGGSWIRLEAIDAAGGTLKQLRRPSPALQQLPVFLKSALRTWRLTPVSLNVASRGVWTGAERVALKERLRGLASKVRVMSDVEGAWWAAFSGRGSGIVLIAGTGSIAYGRDADGCAKRSGGLGPLAGDEGSGFWIGREWFRRRLAPAGKRPGPPSSESVRKFAALASDVFRHASDGNGVARAILNQAQDHLAGLLQDLARRLHWRGSIPVSWGGSLMEEASFRNGVRRALKRRLRRRNFSWISPTKTVAQAMADPELYGRN